MISAPGTSSQPLPYPRLLLPINVKWEIKKRKKGEKWTYSYHHKAYNHKRLANSEIQKRQQKPSESYHNSWQRVIVNLIKDLW